MKSDDLIESGVVSETIIRADSGIAMRAEKERQLSSVFGGAIVGGVNNFDGPSLEKWKLLSLAGSGEEVKGDDALGIEIEVEYIHLHRVSKVDDRTGEIEDWVRTVLITPGRICYSFGSGPVARTAAEMLIAFGPGRFSPPIRVMVREKKIDSKKSCKVIVPV
jgi:hypothetical protein